MTASELRFTRFHALKNNVGQQKSPQEPAPHVSISIPPGDKALPENPGAGSNRALSHTAARAQPLGFMGLPAVKSIVAQETISQKPAPGTTAALENLGTRYNTALSKAAIQLLSHANGREPISTDLIINLLGAIHEATDEPDPAENTSTSGTTDTPEGSKRSLIMAPDQIGNASGLLGSLTALLGSVSVANSHKLERATLNAMEAIGPELLRQWVEKPVNPQPLTQDLADAGEYFKQLQWQFGIPPNPANSTPLTQSNVPTAKPAILCLMDITHFAISFIYNPNAYELLDLALQSLYNRANARSTQYATHGVIRPRIGMLHFWVKSIGSLERSPEGKKLLGQRAKAHLVQLLAIQDERGKSILYYLLKHMGDEDGCDRNLSTILKLVGAVPGYPKETEVLLETILSCVLDQHNWRYLKSYSADLGFCYLLQIGSNSNLAVFVARMIRDLVTYLADKDNGDKGDDVRIHYQATPGFLDAIAFACDNIPSQWGRSLDSFIVSTITLLQRSEFLSVTRVLSARGTLGDLKAASTQMRNDVEKTRFSKVHDEIQTIIKADSLVRDAIREGLEKFREKNRYVLWSSIAIMDKNEYVM